MSHKIQVRRDGDIAVLVLNRPDALNAIDRELVNSFHEKLANIAMIDSVRSVIITGEGRAFCAGADLKDTLNPGDGLPDRVNELVIVFHQAILQIRTMKKPVIAAINGLAVGGGFSLALACDFRVMDRSAVLRLGYPSVGMGIDGGGTFTLPRLVGFAKAIEIAAFDGPIDAEQALDLGLVTKLAKKGFALESATGMARDLSLRALSSFAASKQLFNESFETSLEQQLENERLHMKACAAHSNATEGLTAFIEKRKPSFNKL